MKPVRENVSAKRAEITGGFWKEKQDLLKNVTARAIWDRFEETGRFGALLGKTGEGIPKPHIFWDSDTAKWIEGAAALLLHRKDAELEAKCDELIARACALQAEDGYLNSYFQVIEPENRFTRRSQHELYCLGHWIEAAVVYDEATGKKELLHACEKYADLVDRVFRAEHSAAFDTPGHEEIELALYRLYRHTGKEKYMTLMRYFIDTRGTARDRSQEERDQSYHQAHMPVREQETCEGHSVRAMYLYSAMADQAAEDGDEALRAACVKLWRNCVSRRMYVTGGIGSSHVGESFTEDWDLPSHAAYAETCAALGLALFARRMLRLDLKGEYMDTAELALYNGALSGLSLSGDAFFYENPLAYSPRYSRVVQRWGSKGVHHAIGKRVKVFGCSCCPPNVLRVYGALQEFLYGEDEDALYVHMFASSRAQTHFGEIRQETDYPRAGGTAITLPGGRYALYVRVPGWAREFSVTLNGKAIPSQIRDGYLCVQGPFAQNDCLKADFTLPVLFLRANPKVSNLAGKVCVTRGPVVYCLEEKDNGAELNDLAVRVPSVPVIRQDPAMGLPVITLPGSRGEEACGALYAAEAWPRRNCSLTFIPFHAWANRGENEMQVWVRAE